MPICVTPSSLSQSRSPSRSRVMVEKVRISLRGLRPASPISTQATTVAWSRPAQRSMIASIISSVKLLPWRSPHRKSKTEARAGPNRVATLGDAWMRCRSISCGMDHLPKPDLFAIAALEIDTRGDHLQRLHHIFMNRWCAPARWGSLMEFSVGRLGAGIADRSDRFRPVGGRIEDALLGEVV